MWRPMACIAVLGSCLLLTGCAGPVPDSGMYRHAALQTSLAMVSDLASAQPGVPARAGRASVPGTGAPFPSREPRNKRQRRTRNQRRGHHSGSIAGVRRTAGRAGQAAYSVQGGRRETKLATAGIAALVARAGRSRAPARAAGGGTQRKDRRGRDQGKSRPLPASPSARPDLRMTQSTEDGDQSGASAARRDGGREVAAAMIEIIYKPVSILVSVLETVSCGHGRTSAERSRSPLVLAASPAGCHRRR
jgi:hypothetical protein